MSNSRQIYRRRSWIFTTVFLMLCALIVWGGNKADMPDAILWILGLAATGMLIAQFWALYCYIQGQDEFIAALQWKAIMTAATFTMSLATLWGFFEMFMLMPQISMFFLNPLFWLCYGLYGTFLMRREGLKL